MDKVTLQRRFGSILLSRRAAAGLTQEELADQAGVHRTYLSLLERGKRAPTIEVVRLLAKALETTMTALIAEVEGVPFEPGAPSAPGASSDPAGS